VRLSVDVEGGWDEMMRLGGLVVVAVMVVVEVERGEWCL